VPDTIPGNKVLLEDVIINGESLDLERIYTVGTSDMFTFGYLYPELAVVPEKEYYMPELLRDVLKDTLMKYESSVKL
jgi:5'-nucleotidase